MYQDLPQPFFVLAPMDDVTDTVFRQIVAGCTAPDLFFTEFVNVDGLQSVGREQLLKKLKFSERESPLIAQIWGKEPGNFYKTAQQLTNGTLARELDLPPGTTFAGVDINMGCPDKTVLKNGCCAALIDNWSLAGEIIDATKDGLAGRLPLSVKTRLGLREVNMGWIGFLLGKNLDALTIHGRTAKQMSSVSANWDLISEARQMRDKLVPATKIIGNGDVVNRAHGLELAKRYKLDGIMIGRGIFADPFAFADKSPWPDFTQAQRLELYQKHVELFVATYPSGERRPPTLNKFCKIYVSDFDGAKELREQLMQVGSTAELLDQLAV